jgi:alcohol dehydrogenase class IV
LPVRKLLALIKPHGVTLSALLIACFDYVAVAKAEKMAVLARAMGEPIDGLAPSEVPERVLDTIHYLIKSVNLPATLTDLMINREKTDVHQWGQWKPTRRAAASDPVAPDPLRGGYRDHLRKRF